MVAPWVAVFRDGSPFLLKRYRRNARRLGAAREGFDNKIAATSVEADEIRTAAMDEVE
jgi:hypothetical protein